MKINMNYKIITILIALMLVVGFSLMTSTPVLAATTVKSTGTGGAWGTGSTWVGNAVPGSTDDVEIVSGATVTVTANETCASLTFDTANASNGVTISGTSILTVTGTIYFVIPASGMTSLINVGTGTVSAGSVSDTSNNNSGRYTGFIDINTGSLNVTGNYTGVTGTHKGEEIVLVGPGNVTIGGNLIIGTFTGATGSTTKFGGTVSIGGGNGTTSNTNFTPTGTFNYDGAAQTVQASAIYQNLTLSGSGAKTITTADVTVNGILDMAGTAIASAAPTYGSAATLQYDQTVTAGPEWITPFAATGGVIINNGVVTMNVAQVFNYSVPLTINTGATLAMSTYLLTLNGNLINNGGTTSGSGGVTITGTATQSIGSFTTTGIVSMTKGSGTATFTGNVSGAGLTISGSSSLNLGSGTHTFGVVTLTTGSLYGGSSTLNIVGSVSGAGGSFFPGTGTVNYNGTTGSQTAAGVTTGVTNMTYYILEVNNTSGVTLGGATTVTTLTIGNVTANSIFNDGGFVITPGTSSILNLTSGTYNLGSASVGTAWPAWGTRNITAGTTVGYVSGKAQTVGTVTYSNLVLSGGGAKTIGTAASVTLASGNLSIAGSGATTASVTNTNIGVNSLTLGGVDQVSGTWGSTTATSATHQNNTYFAATTGYLTVTNEITPTQLVFTAVPGTGTAGTAFSVTVQSQDANGNPSNLASATTITLSKASGGGSLSGTLTGNITSGSNSVTISTPVYSVADTMTLTATASGGVTLTAVTSGNIVFSAGLLDHFAISIITSPQTAGTAITGMTLTAQDAYNNTVTSFVSTVTYSGTAGITGTSASFSAGVLSSVSVTPMVAGSGETFIVTGSSKTGTATFTVNPGLLDHFAISTITSPQTAGTAITGMTLTAQDAYNNTVTSFVSTVTYSGTAGITGTSASFSAGVLSSVSVTPMVAGSSETFIVTGSSKTGTATFNVNPGSLNAYKITAASNTPTAGATDVLTITAVDQYGNTVTSVTSESLTFSGLSNAPAGSVPTVTNSSSVATNLGSGTAITFTSGVSNAGGTLVAYDAQGPVTLAATDGTHSTSSTGGAGVSLTVSPASLDHFIFTLATPQTDGVAFTNTNTLTAQDAYNNTISTFNASTNNVTISTTLSGAISGLSGTNKLTSASDFSSGIANLANLNLKYTGTTGSGTFTATSATGSKTGTSNSVTISIGGLDHFVISAISSPQTVGTPITGITLTAQDAGNNTVTSFTTTVTYSGTAGITGTSASFLSGQLTGVSVTPAVAGSSETFIVTGSSKTGTATFNVNPEVFTLTVPVFTTWSPSNGSVLRVGINTSSSTPGSVVASATGWTLTVTASNSDKMKTSGGSPVSLTNPMTFSVDGATYGSSSVYQTALLAEPASGSYVAYQAAGMFNIPLYVKQTVVSTDTAGSYSITLTYIVAPGY